MVIGITLKHFDKLLKQGDKAKNNIWINYLLTKTSDKKLNTNKLTELSFSDFVDLERYFKELDYINFCRIFVKVKTIYVHNLALVMQDYGEQRKELFEQYKWVFDPPQYGEPAKESVGSELRKEFVEEFGNYVILMDVICKGSLYKYKEIEQWKTEEFLFWANYLSGQRIIENVK